MDATHARLKAQPRRGAPFFLQIARPRALLRAGAEQEEVLFELSPVMEYDESGSPTEGARAAVTRQRLDATKTPASRRTVQRGAAASPRTRKVLADADIHVPPASGRSR